MSEPDTIIGTIKTFQLTAEHGLFIYYIEEGGTGSHPGGRGQLDAMPIPKQAAERLSVSFLLELSGKKIEIELAMNKKVKVTVEGACMYDENAPVARAGQRSNLRSPWGITK